MATSLHHQAASSSTNVVETETTADIRNQVSSGVARLRLTKPEARKKVSWTNETVDNEHMNKKKSKCCCVYVKPTTFGESSSDESDDECEHCSGHVEKKHKNPIENDTPEKASQ